MTSPDIPLVDLKAQYSSIKDEIQLAVNRVLESQQFILGPEVELLERELAKYCQCKYAMGVSSGTDALLVSLMAVGIKPGNEVITTPYSFFATAGAIVRLGARPIFVDIDPSTLNIRSDSVERYVTKRTRAIIPVHMAGQAADMDPILEVARKFGLYVVEDACQAIGANYKGRPAGSIGDLGCFSFYPSKNLGGYGDSGLVITNDAKLADKVMLLRNHGHRPKYYNKEVGGNFRMDAIQAAIIRVKLDHLDEWTNARIKKATTYRRLMEQNRIAIELDELGISQGIVPPLESGLGRHIYHLFLIRTTNRDNLSAHLKQKRIASEIYYPLPLHLQECFREMGYRQGDFPHSEKASKQTLALPIYAEITEEMQSRVVSAITEFLHPKSR